MRKFMSVYTPIDISHIYNLKVKENYYIKFLSVLQKTYLKNVLTFSLQFLTWKNVFSL